MASSVARTIIIFSGNSGSGKSTLAEIALSTKGFELVAFAQPLKDFCTKALMEFFDPTQTTPYIASLLSTQDFKKIRPLFDDIDHRNEKILSTPYLTPRILMQKIGTDLVRHHLGPDIWANALAQKIRNNDIKLVAITDLRFPNELEIIKNSFPDYQILHIHLTQTHESLAPPHESESHIEWLSSQADLNILNKKTSKLDLLKLTHSLVPSEFKHFFEPKIIE